MSISAQQVQQLSWLIYIYLHKLLKNFLLPLPKQFIGDLKLILNFTWKSQVTSCVSRPSGWRRWCPGVLSQGTSRYLSCVWEAHPDHAAKCESRHGSAGPERGQRGSVWCALAVVLFIQHIILMSVTPTTFWGQQSSVITEAPLLIYNLSVALLADPCNSSTCRRDLLSPTYQHCQPIILARDAFKFKVWFFFSP